MENKNFPKIIFFSVFLVLFITFEMLFAKSLDISVSIPEKYQEIIAGDTLNFQIQLENPLQAGREDIILEYSIKKNDILVNYKKELKAIETQASFLSTIQVPEETLPGIYDLVVEVNSNNSATSLFHVKSSEIGQIKTYLIILISAIIVIGVLISFELYKLRKTEEGFKKK